MARTVFEVQAVFSCAEAREGAMARLMASGHNRTGFGLLRHGPDVPAPRPDSNDGAAGGIFVLTVRAKDDFEQTRLLAQLKNAGAVRALAIMRLE